jgi:hypothetical protein
MDMAGSGSPFGIRRPLAIGVSIVVVALVAAAAVVGVQWARGRPADTKTQQQQATALALASKVVLPAGFRLTNRIGNEACASAGDARCWLTATSPEHATAALGGALRSVGLAPRPALCQAIPSTHLHGHVVNPPGRGCDITATSHGWDITLLAATQFVHSTSQLPARAHGARIVMYLTPHG